MKDSFKIIPEIEVIKVFRGTDSNGAQSLVFIFKEKPKFEIKTIKIASRILERENEFRIFISLFDEDEVTQEIFDVFVKDIIEHVKSATAEKEVLEIMSKRFQYWTELFKKTRMTLNEQWIRGFWGELYFLDKILSVKLGVDDAIKSWIGPEKANQDFILDKEIFEIKTKTQSSQTVKISNDNQLSREMYLTILTVTKSSELHENSLNLLQLIKNILDKIINHDNLLLFQQKLFEIGLFPYDNAEIYNVFSYEFSEVNYFKITDDFPFINHGNVPKAIPSYKYELTISEISEFELEGSQVWQ